MDILTYSEKIEKLKAIFGQWPPPGTPWCLQVGGGRCGTNSLLNMVVSLIGHDRVTNATFSEIFKVDNGEKTFGALYRSGRTSDTYQNQYLYYNVHQFYDTNIIESLHFPVFLYWLQHAPKVILLKREDYFLRGLSIHFADMIQDFGLKIREGDAENIEKIFGTAIDIAAFRNRVYPYIIENEALTKIVRRLVEPSRLYEIKFSDLYEYSTLQTLRDLADFLEVERTHSTEVKVRLYKETNYDKIKNLDEVMEAFGRKDIEEQERFIPAFYESQGISDESSELADFTIENNMSQQERILDASPIAPKTITTIGPKRKSASAKIQEAGIFYLDKIPDTARYLKTEEFSVLPNMYENVRMLDPRWNSLDTEIPAHINEFFEVTDIASNAENKHKWICGFSVFFLKYVMDSQTEHLERKTAEKYENLIQGVRELIEFPDRCPETLLRFYVSPDAWERLAQEGLLKTKDVEFYKMAYPSEDSQFGTLWRMMALFDKRFQWAIQADVGAGEQWILGRIADWDRQLFYNWLEKNTSRDWTWAGEYLFCDKNFTNDQSVFHDKHRAWDISLFDYISAGGIVTRPGRMPPVEAVLHRHLAERPLHFTFYHADKDVWCQFPGYEYQVPLGWEGWGIDQAIWAFLKKVVPVRHIVHEQSLKHIEETAPTLSKDHIMFRLINQLQKEGSEFVHWKTLEPVFEEK